MAKAKKALPSTTPAAPKSEPEPAEPKVKKKLGTTNRAVIAEGIKKLEATIGKLKGLSAAMESNGVDELTIEGPLLLPRGVNSVMQFAIKLDFAMQRRDRM